MWESILQAFWSLLTVKGCPLWCQYINRKYNMRCCVKQPWSKSGNLSKGVGIPQMWFAPNNVRRELGPVNLNLVLPQSVHFQQWFWFKIALYYSRVSQTIPTFFFTPWWQVSWSTSGTVLVTSSSLQICSSMLHSCYAWQDLDWWLLILLSKHVSETQFSDNLVQWM